MTFTTIGLSTTKDGWIVSSDMLKAIKQELPTLSTEEALRVVDLIKLGLVDVDTKINNW